MRSVSDTANRLRRLVVPSGAEVPGPADRGALIPLANFGSNPGGLDGFVHLPVNLSPGSPMVVVLHGCTQTAEAYDRGSGWSALADRHGFAVLFAQQRHANNPNLCFNWFVPEDVRRGGGEVESIRQMVEAVIQRDRIDPARIYATGLSAGGAMASAMLATAPELFAGGAIIAGLPYGVAGSTAEAFARMRGRGYDGTQLGDLVRRASAHQGPWPSVSVWHGTADATVDPVNAAMIVDQWRGIHGLTGSGTVDQIHGQRRRRWRDRTGRLLIEEIAIDGFGHATPITTVGDEACGDHGPYMLEAGISSTYRIAATWGIVPEFAPPLARRPPPSPRAVGQRFDPASAINDALFAAGLLKR